MTIDLENLKKLALAATPGPWKNDSGNGEVESEHLEHSRSAVCVRYDFMSRIDHYKRFDLKYDPKSTPQTDDDMDYIAACDPQTVLALVERIEYLKSEFDFYHKACSDQDDRLERYKAALEFIAGGCKIQPQNGPEYISDPLSAARKALEEKCTD